MIKKLATKLQDSAQGTEKEFLLNLIREADGALTKLPTIQNPTGDIIDLKTNLEDVIVRSAIIICTGKDGDCRLTTNELHELLS